MAESSYLNRIDTLYRYSNNTEWRELSRTLYALHPMRCQNRRYVLPRGRELLGIKYVFVLINVFYEHVVPVYLSVFSALPTHGNISTTRDVVMRIHGQTAVIIITI